MRAHEQCAAELSAHYGEDDPHAVAEAANARHVQARATQHLHRLGWGKQANDGT